MPNWKKVIVSGLDAVLSSLIVTGSAAVGTSSLGPYENTLTLGARDNGGEGGQLGFNASGGTYTSASFIDLYQNRLRILKGTNATSTGEVANWNMHNLQMALPAYTSPSSFPGTAAATLAVDSGGNVITIAGAGGGTVTSIGTSGTVNGITLTGGTITTSGTITLGGTLSNIQSSQLATSSLMIGSTNIALGATASLLADVTSITATSFTGSLFGTASYATNALSSSYALTASYSNNLQISGSINNVDYIDFNTGSAIPAWKSGRIFWDNTEGALSVYNAEADITLQVGQENWTRVFNDTGVTIANGAAVRIIGTHGDHPEVVLAQSIQVSGSSNLVNQILGLATHAIEASTFGYVTTQGLVRGLNTNAFNDGDTLYVSSSAGQLTNTVPNAPYEIIPVAQVVKASPAGSGILYVAVQQPLDFGDLSSAQTNGGYSYGDLWSYQPNGGTAGVWRHTNQLSGSYTITGSLSNGDGNIASGIGSHAEGSSTTATGDASHTEGQSTNAIGNYSHAEGLATVASGSYQHVQGQFNRLSSAQSAFIVGNGANIASRSNLIFAAGSQVEITGSLVVTAGITGSLLGTASYATQALSASWAPGGAGTPTFPYTGSAIISGSLEITGSLLVQDINGKTNIDSLYRQLYVAPPLPPGAPSVLSIDWGSRTLNDSSGNISVAWRNRDLLTSNGTNIGLDWTDNTYLSSDVYQRDYKPVATQDAVSTNYNNPNSSYLGDVIEADGTTTFIDSTVTDGMLVYLFTDAKWYPVDQSSIRSTYLLGIAHNVYAPGGTGYVLLEGHVVIDDTSTSGPYVASAGYGLPIYIEDSTTTGTMSTIVPTTTGPGSNIVRVLGHCYQQNSGTSTQWMMKFRPSNDWVEI